MLTVIRDELYDLHPAFDEHSFAEPEEFQTSS
jgi:hypothetical protein